MIISSECQDLIQAVLHAKIGKQHTYTKNVKT